MQWSDIPFKPSSRTLRQFALLWILFFGGWGCWQWLLKDDAGLAPWLLGLAALIGLSGLWQPKLIRPIFIGWMCLAFPLGWTVSNAILACLFYLLFTPLGLLFRLMGRDVLAIRRSADEDTYWRPKPVPTDIRSYFRQS